MLLQFPGPNPNDVDLTPTYDDDVVGSGAAGGRAACVLTTLGFKVLLLEAGKYQESRSTPEVKDAWGIPVLRFNYHFGENERKMAKDMAQAGREMFEAAKFEVLSTSGEMLPAGLSIHELGTARMGNDPKTSVVNPGAHDAGVAAFIDKMTAAAFLPEDKESWNEGFVEINRLSLESSKQPFLRAGKTEQMAIPQTLAKGEHEPKTEGEKFFGQLKNTTVFAYYSSDIGIHQEMEYKGNVILEQFVGYDAV